MSSMRFMKEILEPWDRIVIVGKRIESISDGNLAKMQARGYVPHKHHTPLVNKAKELGVPLKYEEIPVKE